MRVNNGTLATGMKDNWSKDHPHEVLRLNNQWPSSPVALPLPHQYRTPQIGFGLGGLADELLMKTNYTTETYVMEF